MQEIKDLETQTVDETVEVVVDVADEGTQATATVEAETTVESATTAEVAAAIEGAEEEVAVATAGVADGSVIVFPQELGGEKVKKRSGLGYGAYLFFKRAFDIISSGLVMLILSPVILICLLIKFFEDFHNPLYVSELVGKDGKIFKFFNIRTMCPNADEMKQELIDQGLNEADGPAFKMENDPRITPFGKFLRKTSLDELPQLLNIFLGSMSVVGPRPPIPREVEEYTEYQKQRLEVKGGLLCLWQIQKDRNSLSFDEWVKLDLEYIEKQSFWLDMKIIFKGAYMVVFDRSGK